jgi:hypothetical protein
MVEERNDCPAVQVVAVPQASFYCVLSLCNVVARGGFGAVNMLVALVHGMYVQVDELAWGQMPAHGGVLAVSQATWLQSAFA